MTKLYQFNKISLIITGVLYLTIVLGLYAQVVLGGIQIISAIGLAFFWNKFNSKHKRQFALYWILVLTYGFGWYLKIDLNDLWWFGIILIPMSIAIYFVWFLNNIKTLKP
ncbi:hypothetical protein [uncultured Winogradskyella sp.]|uniref:hypothetical protein n=1 Tax=uncultured Winogradskyella sp. TaxID=395353 RepID=UPI002607CBAC|nr:hypothetical protein [uncultured Winogradskyella sp.]